MSVVSARVVVTITENGQNRNIVFHLQSDLPTCRSDKDRLATWFPNKAIAFLEASLPKRENKWSIFYDDDVRFLSKLVDLDGNFLIGGGWTIGRDHVVSLNMLDLFSFLRCQSSLVNEVEARTTVDHPISFALGNCNGPLRGNSVVENVVRVAGGGRLIASVRGTKVIGR